MKVNGVETTLDPNDFHYMDEKKKSSFAFSAEESELSL